MKRIAVGVVMLLCLSARADPKADQEGVRPLVEKVQKVYEGTADLHAHFSQINQGVMGKRLASGEVWLKKPGRMRWDYSKPEKKLFIADGAVLWVYEPEDEQVFKQPLSSSQLPAQVSFLFGKGKLSDDFDISRLEGTGSGLGGPGDVVLKLVPKVATAQYRYLAFVVDPKTSLVRETVVYDQQGGSNHLIFSNIETNVKVPDSRFHFTPPEGVKVISAGK